MKIVEVQWHNYRVPFRNSFSTAHGVMTARDGIIVQLTTEQGIIGIGEIAPLSAFGGESLTEASISLPALAAHLYGKALEEALELVLSEGTGGKGTGGKAETKANDALPHILLCGVEIALLDALGKAEGCTVCTLLSPPGTEPRASVPVNAVIGTLAVDDARAAAREASNNGYRCVKLKVGLGGSIQEEIERVAAVRNASGPAMHLRLDANEAWNLEEAIAILSQCVPYDIQYVEQPLRADDLAGMHALRQAVSIPIAVDEALHNLASTQRVLEHEAADVLVIKPQLTGGLRIGQEMIRLAAERGTQCVITSTIETGIGLVAALHLAAASPCVTLECGLATLPLLVDDLLMSDLTVHDGCLIVPTGSGLGVVLDRAALDSYSFRGTD